jgi:hypothetical protein
MSPSTLVINETNLSHAWCRVLNHIIESPGKEVSPLLLCLTDFEQSAEIRQVLDSDLESDGETSIDTVSETIFPISLYELCKQNRHNLYNEYKTNLPRIHKLDRRNARGTYFERLIDFNGKVNQLEIIIQSVENDSSVRRSKLQASIFDPKTDHINGPYQGFPCLQHVTFFVSENGGLVLNSFYAIQLLYKKAYGNWLGLINLGKFMANELKLKFEQLNCYVGVEQLEITKIQGRDLLSRMTNDMVLVEN